MIYKSVSLLQSMPHVMKDGLFMNDIVMQITHPVLYISCKQLKADDAINIILNVSIFLTFHFLWKISIIFNCQKE